jgi:CRISPR-associated endonuclease/helicase Cas3
MSSSIEFSSAFRALTGSKPFPWQESLYERLAAGDLPPSLSIPTGLGKTAAIPIWLIALAAHEEEDGPSPTPRRLVYVVNRRTVVDQATDVVERLRERLLTPGDARWAQHEGVLTDLRERLRRLTGVDKSDDDLPLAVSTLRGQLADNAQWRANPARPAVILGTVDMIGSRLLFSGYRCGFKTKPLHAGFLGQDTLVVHDEAHLEPAFQELLEAIQKEQTEGRTPDRWPLKIMELTATSRGNGEADGLTAKEENPPKILPGKLTRPVHFVWQRLKAAKALGIQPPVDDKQLASTITTFARNKHGESKQAVLVFARLVKDVEEIACTLRRATSHVETLTGTMRGLERDELVKTPVFQRFLPESTRDTDVEIPNDETVYLVCTSAGEVGVDISADHIVCDLSTFESMAQRFGRVNRFGQRDDTRIDVLPPPAFGDTPIDRSREQTLDLLKRLDEDASPLNLRQLNEDHGEECHAAFAPKPMIPLATDILFDAWALTTIRDEMPGRPPVAAYLHGVPNDYDPSQTYVAWREEVGELTGDVLESNPAEELVADYPLKPHELLRDVSERVADQLKKLAKRHGEDRVWLVHEGGKVDAPTLNEVVDGEKKRAVDRIANVTVMLPPAMGGLKGGMLDGSSDEANDVADEWFADIKRTQKRRTRVWDDAGLCPGMRWIRTIDLHPELDEEDGDDEEGGQGRRFWYWYERQCGGDGEASRFVGQRVQWQDHTDDVAEYARRIVDALPLAPELKQAVVLAAKLHDLGKIREVWQRDIGNPNPDEPWAKSGKRMWRHSICPDYRHEFGSLLDVLDGECEHQAELDGLDADMLDLVLHLIATGHGRARPHFPPNETIDHRPHKQGTEAVAVEVARRFARLQRRYGRWGLAYLESLLRAADYAASAQSQASEEDPS